MHIRERFRSRESFNSREGMGEFPSVRNRYAVNKIRASRLLSTVKWRSESWYLACQPATVRPHWHVYGSAATAQCCAASPLGTAASARLISWLLMARERRVAVARRPLIPHGAGACVRGQSLVPYRPEHVDAAAAWARRVPGARASVMYYSHGHCPALRTPPPPPHLAIPIFATRSLKLAPSRGR